MVEQLPVNRQLSGGIRIDKRGELLETLILSVVEGRAISSQVLTQVGKGSETIPKGSRPQRPKRLASDSFSKLG